MVGSHVRRELCGLLEALHQRRGRDCDEPAREVSERDEERARRDDAEQHARRREEPRRQVAAHRAAVQRRRHDHAEEAAVDERRLHGEREEVRESEEATEAGQQGRERSMQRPTRSPMVTPRRLSACAIRLAWQLSAS